MYNWKGIQTRLKTLERELKLAVDNWTAQKTRQSALAVFGCHTLIKSFAEELAHNAKNFADITMNNIEQEMDKEKV